MARLVPVLLCTLALACGDDAMSDQPTEPAPPSHVGSDAASDADASTRVDAGRDVDAGPVSDAGMDAAGNSEPGAGSDGGTESDSGTDPARLLSDRQSQTEACVTYMEGYCEGAVRCGLFAEVEQCMVASEQCPDLMFAEGSTRTVEGSIACADVWRQADCEAFFVAPPAECTSAGTRQPGEPCISDSQCTAGHCSGSLSQRRCGECATQVDEGEACNSAQGIYCAEGLVCNRDTRVCVPTLLPADAGAEFLGEVCDPTSGTACGQHDCARDNDGAYRCRRYPALGETCVGALTCTFGRSYCAYPTLTCLPFPGPREECGIDGFTHTPMWCGAGLRCVKDVDPPTCLPIVGPAEASCSSPCTDGATCQCDDSECSSLSCWNDRDVGDACDTLTDRCVASECQAGSCVFTGSRGVFEEVCN